MKLTIPVASSRSAVRIVRRVEVVGQFVSSSKNLEGFNRKSTNMDASLSFVGTYAIPFPSIRVDRTSQVLDAVFKTSSSQVSESSNSFLVDSLVILAHPLLTTDESNDIKVRKLVLVFLDPVAHFAKNGVHVVSIGTPDPSSFNKWLSRTALEFETESKIAQNFQDFLVLETYVESDEPIKDDVDFWVVDGVVAVLNSAEEDGQVVLDGSRISIKFLVVGVIKESNDFSGSISDSSSSRLRSRGKLDV